MYGQALTSNVDVGTLIWALWYPGGIGLIQPSYRNLTWNVSSLSLDRSHRDLGPIQRASPPPSPSLPWAPAVERERERARACAYHQARMIHDGANESNIAAFRERGCSLNQLPNPIQSSVSPSRPRSHGPGPQTVPVLARLTYAQAIKNPCVVFKMEKRRPTGVETLEMDSEGKRAFDASPPFGHSCAWTFSLSPKPGTMKGSGR